MPTYHFEEWPLVIDGIEFGLFNGSAELERDPGYDHFYVASITLKGQKVTHPVSRHFPRRETVERVFRSPDKWGNRESLEAEMCKNFRDQLEASDAVAEWFAYEMEPA